MGALHHEAGTRFCVRCLARLPGGNAWISGWWSAGVALVSSARRSVGSTPLLSTQLCLARPSIHTLVHARSAKYRLITHEGWEVVLHPAGAAGPVVQQGGSALEL